MPPPPPKAAPPFGPPPLPPPAAKLPLAPGPPSPAPPPTPPPLSAPPTAWLPVSVEPMMVNVPWLYTAPPNPPAPPPPPPAPPCAKPLLKVRFSSVSLPAAVTWNRRKRLLPARVIVSPFPAMVIGLVMRNADGPAGSGTAVVLAERLTNVERRICSTNRGTREYDRVGVRGRVRFVNRVPQTSRSAVGKCGHRECGRRRTVFEDFESEARRTMGARE